MGSEQRDGPSLGDGEEDGAVCAGSVDPEEVEKDELLELEAGGLQLCGRGDAEGEEKGSFRG